MIQPVTITYYLGDSETFVRVLTEQTVTWTEKGVITERSPDFTLVFSGLTPDAEADFAAVYGDGDWLEPFLARHGLTLGGGPVA